MMQITTKAAWKKFSLLLLIPLLGGTMLLLAECTAQDNEPKTAPANETLPTSTSAPTTTPTTAPETKSDAADKGDAVSLSLVEQKPTFNGGDAFSFSLWVNENLKYPPEAIEKRLQGRVTLQFTVETDGSVQGVKVLRGIDPLLDTEAVNVISRSPKWTPGYIGGKPVRVIFNYPVVFQLR